MGFSSNSFKESRKINGNTIQRKIIHFVDEDTSVFNAKRIGTNFWRENVAQIKSEIENDMIFYHNMSFYEIFKYYFVIYIDES